MGSGSNGEFTFMDVLSILSFAIGVKNLDLNVTQEDAQRLQSDLSEKTELLLNEIHGHLEKQDALLRAILEGVKKGDS